MSDNIIPKISDEEFIQQFGCDKATYDKLLCENEDKILKERDKIYQEEIDNIYPYSFIGKYFTYSCEYFNYKNILISDIRLATGYSKNLGEFYSIFTEDENGNEEWLVNVYIDEFLDTDMFTS